MNNAIEKWRNDAKALDVERRLMNESLARLDSAGIVPKQQHCAGRLIFGLDLTGSREHSLRNARIATMGMFDSIKSIGQVAVKLVYFRGTDECRETAWENDPEALSQVMRRLGCKTGETQIARLLRGVLAEREKVSALVYVGDHCEDDPGELRELAGALGARSIPLFLFHECADHDDRSLKAKPTFERMAERSGGVYMEFKPDSGAVLREMLSSVAAFSAAGIEGVGQVALPRTAEGQRLQTGLRLMLGNGGNPQQLR